MKTIKNYNGSLSDLRKKLEVSATSFTLKSGKYEFLEVNSSGCRLFIDQNNRVVTVSDIVNRELDWD